MTRLAWFSTLLFVALVLPACSSLKRAGKDLAVVATAPATIPLRGVYDALEWEEYAEFPSAPVFLSPVAVPLHLLKHAGYTCIYALDLCFSPIYLLASIDPDNGLNSIDLYLLTEGYPWANRPVHLIQDVHENGLYRTVEPEEPPKEPTEPPQQ